MVAYQLPEEVIKTTYEHEKFLTEVIGNGSNTKSKNIAIIGEPGAGKSTLLEKIGKYLIEHNALPIYIPLSNLSGDTLKEYLLKRWLENPITLNQLQELLQQQRVWFLLDGLDEMQAASSVDALNKISQDISKLAAARVVLTCRLNVWDASTKNLLDFQNFKTDVFSSEQVRDFILAWFQRAEEEDKGTEEQGEQLWQKLNESGRERLLDLVKNPLRLALMCQVWDTTKDLPETQAALYKRFTLYHYEWKQAEFSTTLAEQNELNAALGKLAREAIASGKTRFRIGQNFAYRVMGETLFDRACRLGWLNQVDRDKQTDEPFYAFYHATFQEYFAALAIDDWHFFLNHVPNNPSQGTYRIFEPQWKQVILLWLGCEEVEPEQKEQFIKALVEFEDNCNNFYKYRAYILAAMGIAEFGDCCKADEIVGQILKWGLGFHLVGNEAWAVLKETQRTKAIDTLVKDLLRSVENLANKPDSLRFSYSNYRLFNPISMLGQIGIGNEKAIYALAKLVNSGLFPGDIINHAASVLKQIFTGKEKEINALVNLLELKGMDKSRLTLRIERLRQAGTGNKNLIAILVNMLAPQNFDDDDFWQIRKSVEQSSDNPVINAFAKLLKLKNVSYDTICQEASKLVKIEPDNQIAIDVLVELLELTEVDDETRQGAAHSLGQVEIGNQKAINALVRRLELTGVGEDTLYEVVKSLSYIGKGNQKAIDDLVKLLDSISLDDDYMLRIVAESLGKIDPGNEKAINALANLLVLKDVDDNTLRIVAESLGKIDPGNEKAINTLVKLLYSTDINDTLYLLVPDILKQILQPNQMKTVVTKLKDYLSNSEVYHIDVYEEVLWHCAQNMSYPAFYQAWYRR
ncbi:NACHT domain-containing protein [Scytonema sp. PRP1]|uniref:NACHT domain-containing protein n=1 Tax=Scytonema sp. PRP1 TaxID=3120513 RepID=UPI002FCECC62